MNFFRALLVILISISSFVGCSDQAEIIVDPPAGGDQPNILLIIADDLGVDATPGYAIGDIKPLMPNLESLAQNGITFDNVWSYPICSPTRASILTGRYGYRTGVLNVEDAGTISNTETTLQSLLDTKTSNAYSHSIIGKWHLSNREPSRPTDMGVGYYAGLLSGAVSDYDSWSFTENSATSQYSGYITTKLTDLAIDWIDQQDDPWFCWLAYNAPHTPFHLPPAEMHSQGDLPSDQASIDTNSMPYFMAMIESLDFEIGRLLDSIPADELDNTIIIFIGDNGNHTKVIQLPYQTTQSKGTLYQGGILVPMIIAGKGVTRMNERDPNLISSADLFATIAEIAGADLSTYEDSFSFNDLLSAAGDGAREYNYAEVLSDNLNKSGYTIRNEQYKLIQFDSGLRKFFDLIADPYEQNSLPFANLTDEQQTALDALEAKAAEIRQ